VERGHSVTIVKQAETVADREVSDRAGGRGDGRGEAEVFDAIGARQFRQAAPEADGEDGKKEEREVFGGLANDQFDQRCVIANPGHSRLTPRSSAR
jgi:hypothetical protein